MYTFGILVLSGLGVLVLAEFAGRYVTKIHEFLAMALVALGVGAAFLTDLDMFAQWITPVRTHWIGVLMTGLAIAGVGYVSHEVLRFFGGLGRKYNDEAETMEEHEHLRRVA